MSVTMTTADAALKIIYRDVCRDQLNTESAAVYNKIKTSTKDIQGGKSVVKLAPFGVNGGTGAGTETGALPTSGGNNYVNFTSTLKNLYGVIEISDKAVEASKYDQGAFVNLLKAEMEGLTKGAKHSFGRQIYLDGTGKLATCGVTSAAAVVVLASTTNMAYFIEGMIVDIVVAATGATSTGDVQRRITSIDRVNKTITISGTAITTDATFGVYEQGARGNELTGFGSIFADSGSLYGLAKANYSWLVPQLYTAVGAIADKKIVKAMIDVNNLTGGNVDFLPCAPDVYLEYSDYLEATKRNVNTQELKGGFTSISVNGKPMVQDRFIDSGILYPLDTTQFTFHHLADWDWMQDQTGAVLKQVAGYPKWTATLRKYAELICDHPGAQAKMSGITV